MSSLGIPCIYWGALTVTLIHSGRSYNYNPWLLAPERNVDCNELLHEEACRNPRGIFLNKVSGEFCGGFFGGFFGPLSLEKTGGKNPPQNPRQFSNRNFKGSGLESSSSLPLLNVHFPSFVAEGLVIAIYRDNKIITARDTRGRFLHIFRGERTWAIAI